VLSYKGGQLRIHTPHNAVAIKEKRAEVTESSAKSNDQEHRDVLNPQPPGVKQGAFFRSFFPFSMSWHKTLVEITERPAMVTCLQQD